MLQASTPEEDRIIEEHVRYLTQLTKEGIVLLAGRTLNTDPSAFGVVILEAPSDVEALQRMLRDPAVEAGVFQAQLFPYRVALASPQLRSSESPQG